MSIFRGNINEVTIEDVELLISEQYPENIRLEYKEAFSSKDANFQIAKEVSSFANQQGGILLFGVSENENRLPDKITGIDKTDNPRQKIQAVCFEHIYPPIVPEIQECEVKGDPQKVVAVVRVPMSDETPHTISNRTGFYIRADDNCMPRPMTDEEIVLLSGRRSKIVEIREKLLTRSYKRVFPADVKRDYMLTPSILFAIPIFPLKNLTGLQELYDIYEQCKVPYDEGFPLLNRNEIKTAADSVYSFIPIHHKEYTIKKEQYGELNVFGQVTHFVNAMRKPQAQMMSQQNEEGIDAGWELRTVYRFLIFMRQFYSLLHFSGIIRIIYRVENCRGVRLYPPPNTSYIREPLSIIEVDSDIEVTEDYSVQEIVNETEKIVIDLFKRFLHGCGLRYHTVRQLPVGRWVDSIKKDWRI